MKLLLDGLDETALVSCDHLARERYGTTRPLLDQNLKLLDLKTQEIAGEAFLTYQQVKLLDEYYNRLWLGWLVTVVQGGHLPYKGI